MSSGNNLQEMEVGTKQSQTAVNAGAKAADPMPTLQGDGSQLAAVEDLGGPTPENYKTDDALSKLRMLSIRVLSLQMQLKESRKKKIFLMKK